MRVVLEASAAVQVALGDRSASQIAAALEQADEVLAPDLLVAEVTNVFWKYHQFAGLELAQCQEALAFALTLADTLIASKDLAKEAFQLSRVARKPAYDMFCVALARREDAELATLDKSLRKEARRQGIRILAS